MPFSEHPESAALSVSQVPEVEFQGVVAAELLTSCFNMHVNNVLMILASVKAATVSMILVCKESIRLGH